MFCTVLYCTVLYCAVKLYIPSPSYLLLYFFIVYVLGNGLSLLAHDCMAVYLVPVAPALLPAMSLRLWKCPPSSRPPMAVRYDYELNRQVQLNSINLTHFHSTYFHSTQLNSSVIQHSESDWIYLPPSVGGEKLYSAVCGKAREMNIIDDMWGV